MAENPQTTSPAGSTEQPAVDFPTDAPIEVDSALRNDADSVIDDQLSAFSASLTSSVVNYPVEHGRRYHAFRSGAYPMPNDEPELERLDLIHAMNIKGSGDKLYHAPIEADKVRRILDVGTGTGIWAIAMGDLFPAAEVLGNDLSPVQPCWVPPNVKFEVDDVESPWLYNVPFDFIFSRYMAASIKDWPKLVQSVYENVAPGGWAEFQDYDFQYYSEDGSLKDDSDILTYVNTLLGAARKSDRDPCPGKRLEQMARNAGFENIVHQRFKFPIGPWPRDPQLKTVGLFNLRQTLDGLEGFTLRLFCDVLGWKEEEVTVLLAKVRKALKDTSVHPQYDYHVVYGQKPSS